MLTHTRSFALVFTLLILSAAVPRSAGQVSFGNPATYQVGTSPIAAVVGDFNNDGKMDLAVVNSGFNSSSPVEGISVLLGNGDGTFQPARNFDISNNPVVVVTADFNHDGRLDLAVASSAGPVSILLGNGDGTFQPASEISTVVGGYVRLAVGDFQGKGSSDLATYDDSGVVNILLSNGDGTFQPKASTNTGYSNFAVGDFNGDHKLDLALADSGFCNPIFHPPCPPPHRVRIFLGNGDGTFQPPVVTSLASIGYGLATGDFNGDGKLDVAQGDFVLLGNGNGTFQVGMGVASTSPAGAADINGDGKLDLMSFGSSWLVALGNGDGTFQTPISISSAFPSAVSDLNGDGLPDLVEVDSSNNVVNVLLNTTPGFTLLPSPSTASVTAGGSATYTINLGQQNGFGNTATLACSAPASVGIQCSLSPSSASPGSSAKLTVTTTGLSAALLLPSRRENAAVHALCLPIGGLTLLGIGLGSARKRCKKLSGLLPFCVLFGNLAFLAACGGTNNNLGGNSRTPSGNYTITIKGTSGLLQRSTMVTLSVQ